MWCVVHGQSWEACSLGSQLWTLWRPVRQLDKSPLMQKQVPMAAKVAARVCPGPSALPAAHGVRAAPAQGCWSCLCSCLLGDNCSPGQGQLGWCCRVPPGALSREEVFLPVLLLCGQWGLPCLCSECFNKTPMEKDRFSVCFYRSWNRELLARLEELLQAKDLPSCWSLPIGQGRGFAVLLDCSSGTGSAWHSVQPCCPGWAFCILHPRMTAWAQLGLSVPRSGGADVGVCEFAKCQGLVWVVQFREPHAVWQKPAQPHFTPDSEDVIPVPAASIYQERSFFCQILGIIL